MHGNYAVFRAFFYAIRLFFSKQYNDRVGIMEHTGGEMNKILCWAKAAAGTTHTQQKGVDVTAWQTPAGKLKGLYCPCGLHATSNMRRAQS